MSVQIKQSFQTVRVCFWSEERKRRGKDWQSLGVAGPSGARLLNCQDLSKCDNNNVCADEMLFPDCESLFLVGGKEKGEPQNVQLSGFVRMKMFLQMQ